jgi:hypothetical protein
LKQALFSPHRNIVAAVAWLKHGSPTLERVGDVRQTNSIAALPLYHIFALTTTVAIRWGPIDAVLTREMSTDYSNLEETALSHSPGSQRTYSTPCFQHPPQFKTVDFSSLCVSGWG